MTDSQQIAADWVARSFSCELWTDLPRQRWEDFTFNQYKTLICSKSNWPLFEPLFDTMRELVDADFGDVNDLRNIVFHFRRGITPKDTDRLRRFRDRLRYDREIFVRRNELRETTLAAGGSHE